MCLPGCDKTYKVPGLGRNKAKIQVKERGITLIVFTLARRGLPRRGAMPLRGTDKALTGGKHVPPLVLSSITDGTQHLTPGR